MINRVLLQKPPHTNEKGKKIEGGEKNLHVKKGEEGGGGGE